MAIKYIAVIVVLVLIAAGAAAWTYMQDGGMPEAGSVDETNAPPPPADIMLMIQGGGQIPEEDAPAPSETSQ